MIAILAIIALALVSVGFALPAMASETDETASAEEVTQDDAADPAATSAELPTTDTQAPAETDSVSAEEVSTEPEVEAPAAANQPAQSAPVADPEPVPASEPEQAPAPADSAPETTQPAPPQPAAASAAETASITEEDSEPRETLEPIPGVPGAVGGPPTPQGSPNPPPDVPGGRWTHDVTIDEGPAAGKYYSLERVASDGSFYWPYFPEWWQLPEADNGNGGGQGPDNGTDPDGEPSDEDSEKNQVSYWESQYPGTTGVKHDNLDTASFTVPAPPVGTEWVVAIVKAGSRQSVDEPNYVDTSVATGDFLSHPSGKTISHVILLHRPISSGGGGDDGDKLEGFTSSEVVVCTEANQATGWVKFTIDNPNGSSVDYRATDEQGNLLGQVTVQAKSSGVLKIEGLAVGEYNITLSDRDNSVTSPIVIEECEDVHTPVGDFGITGQFVCAADGTYTGTFVYHNDSEPDYGSVVFEGVYDGIVFGTTTVPAGTTSEPIIRTGIQPGAVVRFNVHDTEHDQVFTAPAEACQVKQPTEPTGPVTPTEPEKPQVPQTPTQPSTPDTPVVQVAHPVAPGYPLVEQEPDASAEQVYTASDAQLAETGANGWVVWVAFGLIGFGAAAMLVAYFLRRRQTEVAGE